MSALIHTQILRVMLFGPSSLSKKRPSGPTSNGVRWGVREATPGMIALAAMIVSVYLLHFSNIGAQFWSVGSLPALP